MIKRRFNEWHENHEFPDDVHFFVNGKELKPRNYDVARMFYDACRRIDGLEDWIRDYLDGVGFDEFNNASLDEICEVFATELKYYFDDCEDGEFYVDGGGIVYDDHGVNVEIFDDEPIRESKSRTLNRRRFRR